MGKRAPVRGEEPPEGLPSRLRCRLLTNQRSAIAQLALPSQRVQSMEFATPGAATKGHPTFELVCYQCQYRGASQGAGAFQTGCPMCDFPLIATTEMSPSAVLSSGLSAGLKRSTLLPGIEPTPSPPATAAEGLGDVALAAPRSSWWSTAAICALAVALGVIAKAMQTVL